MSLLHAFLQSTLQTKMSTKVISLVIFICSTQISQSQYSISDPSINCMAAPCDYSGECRAGSGDCGEGSDYCNADAIWLPACGGGGTLEKDPVFTASTDTPVQMEDTNSQTAGTDNKGPTSSPTTAWDAWINGKNNGGEENTGVIGYTTGKEGEEDWEADEEPGWFDKQGWESGNRTKDEDASFFDKYNPFSKSEEDKSAAAESSQHSSSGVAVAGVAVAFAAWL